MAAAPAPLFPEERLRILLVGNGGREHALAVKLAESPLVDTIFVAPGNGGTGFGGKTVTVGIAIDDFDGLVSFAVRSQVNLVIPGPEQPLVDGIELPFRRVGIPVFGPSPRAAQMEGSKTFSKDFMARYNIPTAAYRNFSDVAAAKAYVLSVDHDVVLKASGLAAGKGVLIPSTKEEALAGLEELMVSKAFGSAGDEVVVEELLVGQEISILALSDGYTVKALPGAQDHKRIGEGDTGLNTGGMGAYAPAPCLTPELEKEIMANIIQPTIDGMRKDGMPFVGCLFTGFMLTPDGPKVLEYNVRFGDPETQTCLGLLETDLATLMVACVERRLDSVELKLKPNAFAVSVVLASKGYPGSYPKGDEITFGTLPANVQVYHAGTARTEAGKVVTAGGRVLAVTAVAGSLKAAQELAYEGVKQVTFAGATFRRDIGYRAFLPEAQAKGMTYASAGVSIDAGNELVQRIKPFVKATKRIGTDSVIGGFGGLFDLKACGFKDPIIVSGTDGVGTKLKVAQQHGKHDTIGIDLVAMSVNDLIVQGAEPLFFLDYFACGSLDVPLATDVIKGVAAGCTESGCALVGGETAEMPSLYHGSDYDLAGFAVGAVERDLVLPRPDIKAGDVLLGLESDGLHSNGFSLVRRIIDSQPGLVMSSPAPWDTTKVLGDEVLTPTRLYVKQLLPLLKKGGLIKGLSHITGGGFTENIPRMFPSNVGCWVDAASFPFPPIFKWLMKAGRVEGHEMARTFNCGIGMAIAVAAEDVDEVLKALESNGGRVWKIGECVQGEGCEMRGLESWGSQ